MTASTLPARPRGATPAPAAPRPTRRRRRGIADPGRGVAYVVAAVVIVAMLAPVAFIVIGGFRTNAQITTDPTPRPGSAMPRLLRLVGRGAAGTAAPPRGRAGRVLAVISRLLRW